MRSLLITLFAFATILINCSYTTPIDNLLHYVVRQPKIKTVNPRLLVLLHGRGSNEKDLFAFAEQLPSDFLVISARAPYKMADNSYCWYEMNFTNGKIEYNKTQVESSRTTIIQFIDQLKTTYHFDDKQVYLCGFSQGAIMSYAVGLTTPDKIKGIAVMSGRLPEEVKPLIATKEKLKKLRIFISHGTNDKVLSIAGAREAITYLKQKGLEPDYKEYPAVHTISNEMFTDLLVWLNKK